MGCSDEEKVTFATFSLEVVPTTGECHWRPSIQDMEQLHGVIFSKSSMIISSALCIRMI